MYQVTVTTATEYPGGRKNSVKRTTYFEESPTTKELEDLRHKQVQEFKELYFRNPPKVTEVVVDVVGQDGEESYVV